ncbi:hypothetical protein G4G28_14465 [Massilia sp. Dwa41.01b]|uniref:hypothetical protein n=1 Tax=Massilia sp. Dwa41.01b TaxID=2709302 RepID=UPI001602A305|nr:hypothetical protein [Massilia sp. Dwa41.01b]QNA89377.1 hypothetical protein G4G28_14465 [Massilia sp. Dwa41.01b]
MNAVRQLDIRPKIAAALGLPFVLNATLVLWLLSRSESGTLPGPASVLFSLAACLALAAARAGAWLAREATRPLHEALQLARRVADGDLRVRTISAGRGDGTLMLSTWPPLPQSSPA